MSKIRKTVITAAGKGMRLLPYTKETPKEMMPIYSKTENGKIVLKPILQIVYESIFDYGIKDFCFIVGRGKRSIEDHFVIPEQENQKKIVNVELKKHIPKEEFAKYGISKKNIIQYNAMDEYMIVKGVSHRSSASKLVLPKPKTILIRTHELKAAYFSSEVDIIKIIKKIVKEFSDCNILVLGRYSDEIISLKKSLSKKITVLDKVVDSGEILSRCDIFIGSGGTMTSEAALRGIPTISYDAVPNLDEKYLVKNGLIKRAKNAKKITKITKQLLDSNQKEFQKKARNLLNSMEDPYSKLNQILKSI